MHVGQSLPYTNPFDSPGIVVSRMCETKVTEAPLNVQLYATDSKGVYLSSAVQSGFSEELLDLAVMHTVVVSAILNEL